MSLSVGSLKDEGVFLEALVLYVLISVFSESVVEASGSSSKLAYLEIRSASA